jgi:hypothetical protein
VCDADFRGRIYGAKRQSMTSVGEVTAEEGRGRKWFFVRPAANRTGELWLMRLVWYHKTTASALAVNRTGSLQSKKYISLSIDFEKRRTGHGIFDLSYYGLFWPSLLQ